MSLYCFFAICILSLTSRKSDALIQEAPLPLELKKCYEHYSKSSLSNVVGKSLCWFCEAPIKRKMEGAIKELLPEQKTYVDRLYQHINGAFRGKRQANMCVRKEYRMLTDEERFNFHRAVNLLKANTTVSPNKYDAIALLHTGQATLIAHGGPNFFGWHRIYLLMMEQALQEEVPGVCLPYIDNTLERELDEDEISYLFSDEFLGTANGAVTTGPFANWTTPFGPLTRNVGNQGEPMSKEQLDAILSRSSMMEVTAPSAEMEFDMEFHHGSFHVYIGGHMESLDRASFDPTFFMHHTYVDYMWQLFREELRRKGGDPTFYPEPQNNPEFHARNASLGFGDLVAEDGYSEAIVNYVYLPAPTCSPRNRSCGSIYLRCNPSRWRCVPINPNSNPGPVTPSPTTPGPVTSRPTTSGPSHPTNDPPTVCNSYKRDKNRFIRAPKSCQNTFCVDGKCDINQWIYFPVKIITNRPPEYEGSSSFPVRNGKIETRGDIYEPQVYSNVNQYVRKKSVAPKGYANCEDTHGIGQIFISSQGLNYDGYYSESSIVDQRLATSISIAYMAVKNMGRNGKSTALLRAFDQCGRICHTACKIPGSNPPRNRPCSGVVDITPDFPKQYGKSFGDALLDVWGYKNDRECPTFETEEFFISFYCDYRDRLPWVNGPESSTLTGIILPQPAPQPPQQNPAPSVATRCEVTTTCTLNVACGTCSKYGQKLPCINDCSQYALCVYGHYRTRRCPSRMKFDESRNTCIRGSCAHSLGRINFGSSFNMFSNQLFG